MGEKTFRFLVEGGKVTAGPPLGPALGPLGLNVMAVAEEANRLTQSFNGMRVPIEVVVDTDTKKFEIRVGTPSTSALLSSAAGVQKGSGTAGRDYVSDLKFTEIVKIAEKKLQDMRSKTLKAAVKEILGSCVSMGIKVDGKNPKEVIKLVEQGKYDNLLGEQN
ncbi:MAG: 50S ribosomal protein L11 [Candidatus Caldarchaeum sp.]|uniref:Large ribosomal subunit protein uL11 n=1 Tax=Caldiarchaeum subterraneum TaxID=311458 RepID=A0A7C4HXB7_CALS0|nr:50S ribosomal protein L11 [Candidatus Caldarchaeales archaeon]MDJ0273519.1 50S ribosomal protein L11 [Candidatus Caldarchaeales archaeon]